MTFHKKRTNKRHLHPKRHASHARKVSRSRKGGFGDEESPDDDIDKGSLAEEQANMDADNMELGGLPKEEEPVQEPVQEPMEEKEPPGPWWVGGKSNKSRRHSKKRKAHKTHKRRHARKHSKSHKKK